VVAIISVRGSLALIGWSGRVRSGDPAEFLDRTEPDAIGFAERAVDGSRLGHTHFGATDEGGDIRRIGVSKPHKSLRSRRRVDRCLENPTAYDRITKLAHLLDSDA
jgi:hypothetical protein